jgi:hypothetical protein
VVRFLFRSVFRLVRLVVRVGLLAGLGFAVVKLVQNRRDTSALSGGPEWTTAPSRPTAGPARSGGETPLVEPHMLRGASLRRADAPSGDGGADGKPVSTATRAITPTPPAEVAKPAEEAKPADGAALGSAAKPAAGTRAATSVKRAAKKATAKRAVKKAAAKKKAAKKKAAKKAAGGGGSPGKVWVDPDGNICPATHPVKGKLSSGIFHLPGMAAYERTSPDRCYRDDEAAEAEGLRRAKR